jgi:hypothetical protein
MNLPSLKLFDARRTGSPGLSAVTAPALLQSTARLCAIEPTRETHDVRRPRTQVTCRAINLPC